MNQRKKSHNPLILFTLRNPVTIFLSLSIILAFLLRFSQTSLAPLWLLIPLALLAFWWRSSPKLLLLLAFYCVCLASITLPPWFAATRCRQDLASLPALPLHISGTIVNAPPSNPPGWLWIRVDSASRFSNNLWTPLDWQGACLEITSSPLFDLEELSCGQQISFLGYPRSSRKTQAPWDFNRAEWLISQGVAAQISLASPPEKTGSNPLPASLRITGKFLASAIDSALLRGNCGSPDDQAVARAIVLGNTSSAPPELVESFRRSGTLHAFAVSGMNVGMLALILSLILLSLRAPVTPTLLAVALAVAAYALATGLAVSALRSALMAILVIAAFLSRWNIPLPTRIALSALILTTFEPLAIFLPGFQLSFLVLVALVAVTPKLDCWVSSLWEPSSLIPQRILSSPSAFLTKTASIVKSALIASTVAWFASAPLMAFHFHAIYPMGIPASFILVPILFTIMLLAILSVALGWISIPWLAIPLNSSLMATCSLCSTIAQSFSSLPGSAIPVPQPLAPHHILIPNLPSGSRSFICLQGNLIIDSARPSDLQLRLFPCLQWSCAAPQSLILTSSRPSSLLSASQLARQFSIPEIISDSPPQLPQNSSWLGALAPNHPYPLYHNEIFLERLSPPNRALPSPLRISRGDQALIILGDAPTSILDDLPAPTPNLVQALVLSPSPSNPLPAPSALARLHIHHLILLSSPSRGFSLSSSQLRPWSHAGITIHSAPSLGPLIVSLDSPISITPLSPPVPIPHSPSSPNDG